MKTKKKRITLGEWFWIMLPIFQILFGAKEPINYIVGLLVCIAIILITILEELKNKHGNT